MQMVSTAVPRLMAAKVPSTAQNKGEEGMARMPTSKETTKSSPRSPVGDGTVVRCREIQSPWAMQTGVNEISHPHRFVQAIFGVQGLHGGLGQVFLTHKGVARQKLLHEKHVSDTSTNITS